MPVELTKALIARASVTPDDAGCQNLISERLQKIGFKIVSLPFGDVTNLWAIKGDTAPLFCFVGHTDVVPAGDLSKWKTPPFEPIVKDGLLYGRGAADMKSAVAAMVVAAEEFVTKHPEFGTTAQKGSIAFLLTSDEEGPSINGTKKVVEYLKRENIKIDWCLVGEPSSETQLGDMIKYGRRGSLSGAMRVEGIQGHIAYPHKALNPIHAASSFLAEVTQQEWDQGDEHFPATSFQISNIHAGTGANNVIPGFMDLHFNFRFSPKLSADELKNRLQSLAQKHGLNFDIQWTLGGEPFLTNPDNDFVENVKSVINTKLKQSPKLCTHGGTSDGRFIAPLGAAVIEFGLINESIHQCNEHAKIEDIQKLCEVYGAILEKCFY